MNLVLCYLPSELKKCSYPEDITDLGFLGNEVLSTNFSYYQIGETIGVSCQQGHFQHNDLTDTENIICG